MKNQGELKRKKGNKKGTALVEPSLQHNHENTILILKLYKKVW